MQMNLFKGYADCNPKDTTIEEVFQMILQDAQSKTARKSIVIT